MNQSTSIESTSPVSEVAPLSAQSLLTNPPPMRNDHVIDAEVVAERHTDSLDLAKVLRVQAMAGAVLGELHRGGIDDPARVLAANALHHTREVLAVALPQALSDELAALVLPLEAQAPSDGQLRLAHAQLGGWLDAVVDQMKAVFVHRMEQSVHQMALEHATSAEPTLPTGSYL